MIKAPNNSYHNVEHESAAAYVNAHCPTIRIIIILEKEVQHSSYLEIKWRIATSTLHAVAICYVYKLLKLNIKKYIAK